MIVTVVIALGLGVCFFLAIKHIRKNGTCGGDCGGCNSCPDRSKCDIMYSKSEEHYERNSHSENNRSSS